MASIHAAERDIDDKISRFLEVHCQRCHNEDDAEGNFRVDNLGSNFTIQSIKSSWRSISNVLQSHQMPPEGERQPRDREVSDVIDWITQQAIAAELSQRSSSTVLRRLNRLEYQNTIRDLTGIDVDVSGFPEDPPAGGFDNNGKALSLSPLLLELYLKSATEVISEALVLGPRPSVISWRFEPESGQSDSNRVRYANNNVIVNGGRNAVAGDFVRMHHDNWDRGLSFRDFKVPNPGKYIVRIRAGGKIPSRTEVIASAETFLKARRDRDDEKNPKNTKYHLRAYEEQMDHFRIEPMYEYGPPRLKLTQTLGGQPRTISTFDVDAPYDEPRVYEFAVDFSTDSAGLSVHYAYDIPAVLENFTFQRNDNFARPEAWVDWIEIEGPVYREWPPESHQRIVMSDDPRIFIANPTEQIRQAEKIIEIFMQRAYRRPVSDQEVQDKLTLFKEAIASKKHFLDAIELPLVAILVSPHFLHMVEGEAPTSLNRRHKLNQFELASRLSYFLWSSMPDDRLFELASNGSLAEPDILDAEVDRMLEDDRAVSFVKSFSGQWLNTREVGTNPPASDLFPKYDRHLEASAIRESEAFFAEILYNDLSVMNFVASDFIMINERLARFYGIPDVKGDDFRRVAVPPGVHRGGVITQASILSLTSNGTRTSPVKRGTWIMKNLLGIDPGLPVADAGDIAPNVPGIEKATVRQRLEIHRSLPQCARCHDRIDPLGLAMENFDAAGAWRDREGFGYKGRVGKNDPWIDASASMIDGTHFDGVRGIQKVLLERRELFLKCLSGKMFTYALGRELGMSDDRHLMAAVDHMQKGNDSLRGLIKWIVMSEPFQSK